MEGIDHTLPGAGGLTYFRCPVGHRRSKACLAHLYCSIVLLASLHSGLEIADDAALALQLLPGL